MSPHSLPRWIARRSALFACLVPMLAALHLGGADAPPHTTFVAIRPVDGGDAISRPLPADGAFTFEKLPPGRYQLAVTSQPVTKQTQAATFGERVNAGMPAGRTKPDTAKNSIGNIRAVDDEPPGATTRAASAPGDAGTGLPTGKRHHKPAAAATDASTDASTGATTTTAASPARDFSMPNRISMNVSVGKTSYPLILDGPPIEIEVGADGRLSGRADPRPVRRPGSGDQRPGKGDSSPPPDGGSQSPAPAG